MLCPVLMSVFFRNTVVVVIGGCFVLVWFLQKGDTRMIWSLKNLLCGEKFAHPILLGDMITRSLLWKGKNKIQCWKKCTLFVVQFRQPSIWWILRPLKSQSQVHILQNTYNSHQVMQELMLGDGSGIPFYMWDTGSYQSKELDSGFPNPRLLLQWPMILITLTLNCANCMNVLSSFLIISELTGNIVLKYF